MAPARKDVIVGVDGSAHSRLALDWAVAKSEVLGPVVPVLSYNVEALGDGLGMPSMYAEVARVIREDAEYQLKESIQDHPELASRARLIMSHPGPALVKASAGASLLVVGSRGRGAVAETLFGSVGSYCVNHATVPVVVITENTPVAPTIDVAVVGVDGSDNSARALDWAARHVDPAGRVIAVGSWIEFVYTDPPSFDPALEVEAEKMVSETVARVREAAGEAAETWPTIEVHVERGDPRLVLRAMAKEADLLVVGARGHRGVPHLLLGSTTTSLLHHPTAPTVVVPGVGDDRRR